MYDQADFDDKKTTRLALQKDREKEREKERTEES
jgi:hypothetical protein